jgi:hypothetical protein
VPSQPAQLTPELGEARAGLVVQPLDLVEVVERLGLAARVAQLRPIGVVKG